MFLISNARQIADLGEFVADVAHLKRNNNGGPIGNHHCAAPEKSNQKSKLEPCARSRVQNSNNSRGPTARHTP